MKKADKIALYACLSWLRNHQKETVRWRRHTSAGVDRQEEAKDRAWFKDKIGGLRRELRES